MSDYTKPIRPIITGTPNLPKVGQSGGAAKNTNVFADMLREQLQTRQTLTLSRHAQTRAQQRGIELTEADMTRLGEAAQKAQDKGLGDALVMMDQNAFIINIPNRVIVTMVNQGEKETIFTNIDGAVII